MTLMHESHFMLLLLLILLYLKTNFTYTYIVSSILFYSPSIFSKPTHFFFFYFFTSFFSSAFNRITQKHNEDGKVRAGMVGNDLKRRC